MAFRAPSEKVKALVAAAPPEIQALFAKQEEFTNQESRFLKKWLQAAQEGRFDLAERLVDHGARLEHWRSLLPSLRADMEPDARGILDALDEEFSKHEDEFDERGRIGFADREKDKVLEG